MLQGTADPKHRAEAASLRPEPYVELFKLTVDRDANTAIYMTNHPTIRWDLVQGSERIWENYPLIFSGYNTQTTGEQSRPKLQIANPNGLFSRYIADRILKKAILERYMVLRDDLIGNNPRYLRNKWVVNRVLNLTRETITFELRSVLDGTRYTLPVRQYISPEFPTTSLS